MPLLRACSCVNVCACHPAVTAEGKMEIIIITVQETEADGSGFINTRARMHHKVVRHYFQSCQ